MLTAALARDADRAAAALSAHIERTAAVLLAVLEGEGEVQPQPPNSGA